MTDHDQARDSHEIWCNRVHPMSEPCDKGPFPDHDQASQEINPRPWPERGGRLRVLWHRVRGHLVERNGYWISHGKSGPMWCCVLPCGKEWA